MRRQSTKRLLASLGITGVFGTTALPRATALLRMAEKLILNSEFVIRSYAKRSHFTVLNNLGQKYEKFSALKILFALHRAKCS
jgi:hypothetical protein